MNIARHLCLLGILFLFFSFQSKAQDSIYPGYIIHSDGNQEQGLIIPGGAFDNQTGITFKNNTDEIYYGIDQLEGYSYEHTVLDAAGNPKTEKLYFKRKDLDFAPVPDGDQTVFVEVKTEGKLSLYSLYIELKANVDDKVRQLYLIEEENGKIMKMNKLSFLKRSKIIFRDYPGLQSQLGKFNFRFENLARMIKDYNFQKENGHDIDVYKVSPVNYAKKEQP